VRRRDAGRAADHVDAEPRVIGDRRAAGGARRMARLGERVLDEGDVRLVGFVEVQGTAEGAAFSRAEMDALLSLADKGIRELVAAQRAALEA